VIHVALIGVLVVHGIAHLPGFAVPWQLITSAELPYRTTILAGRLDIGDAGVRAVGLAWAVAAAAFIVLAWSLWAGLPWTRTLIACAVAYSLVLCAVGWPEARIGVAANILILALLAAAR
jgi:hypothetical protein